MALEIMDLEDALYVYGHPGEYPAEFVAEAAEFIGSEPMRRVKMLDNVRGHKGATDLLRREEARVEREIDQLASSNGLPDCFSVRLSTLRGAVVLI